MDPPTRWIALNVDDCLTQNNSKSEGVGILHSGQGKWISGFMHNICCCTVKEAELWAICDELKLTWKLEYKRVRLEVDTETVEEWIKLEENVHSQALNLLDKCHNLILLLLDYE